MAGRGRRNIFKATLAARKDILAKGICNRQRKGERALGDRRIKEDKERGAINTRRKEGRVDWIKYVHKSLRFRDKTKQQNITHAYLLSTFTLTNSTLQSAMAESNAAITNAVLLTLLPGLQRLGQFLDTNLNGQPTVVCNDDPAEYKCLLHDTLVAPTPAAAMKDAGVAIQPFPTESRQSPGGRQDDVRYLFQVVKKCHLCPERYD